MQDAKDRAANSFKPSSTANTNRQYRMFVFFDHHTNDCPSLDENLEPIKTWKLGSTVFPEEFSQLQFKNVSPTTFVYTEWPCSYELGWPALPG